MAEVVHTSHITIVQKTPPIRTAFIEKFSDPVTYGMHGGIAKFYGMESEEEHPATLDHMIAAVGA